MGTRRDELRSSPQILHIFQVPDRKELTMIEKTISGTELRVMIVFDDRGG